MIRYLFTWAPAVVVLGTVVILSSAYLALIVLALITLVLIPLLVGAVVLIPYVVVRSWYRSWPRVVSAGDEPLATNAHESTLTREWHAKADQ